MRRRYLPRPGNRVFRPPRVRPWRIVVPRTVRPRGRVPSSLVLVFSFMAGIALGTGLLLLPISTQNGVRADVTEALFTVTSAVCVTGLTVVDTADYWSRFGQAVIIILIQFGGLGFMTGATLFLILFGRRIGLRGRVLVGESLGAETPGGVIRLVRRIAFYTLIVEGVGALLLLIRFLRDNSPGLAIWKSVFHAISAFNNAGFDILGGFRSFIPYQGDALVLLVLAALIILGGISYLAVADVLAFPRTGKLALDTKLVLSVTFALLFLGTVAIFFSEFFTPNAFAGMSTPEKLLNAFFMSVVPRTAGFTSVMVGLFPDYILFFIILLMFIGGASASTAGGIKVNTFGVLIAAIYSSIRGMERASAYGRDFTQVQVNRALTVVMLSLALIALVVLLLSIFEGQTFLSLLFETVSAFGTVGLTTGVTPHLSTAGRLIVIGMMFAGRLGPLTLAVSLLQQQRPSVYRRPTEPVRIG